MKYGIEGRRGCVVVAVCCGIGFTKLGADLLPDDDDADEAVVVVVLPFSCLLLVVLNGCSPLSLLMVDMTMQNSYMDELVNMMNVCVRAIKQQHVQRPPLKIGFSMVIPNLMQQLIQHHPYPVEST